MDNGRLVVLSAAEVQSVLDGARQEVLDAVREAYCMHERGETSLPHSGFLRFPDRPANRIISLPAFLGGREQVAGIKWIASVPSNTERGMERASALIVLNSPDTGRPWSVLEGAAISAARTAASAAVAARTLHDPSRLPCIGLVGCGRINFEIARYLREALTTDAPFLAFDLDPTRGERFASAVENAIPGAEVRRAASLHQVLAECPLVAFATTAVEPHVADLSTCPRGATILHVSLRDLAPETILCHDNVVDDFDHVCRAQTSIHLAAQQSGRRDFVRCGLGEVLTGARPARPDPEHTTIFSPFGLGILDLAVARRVHDLAVAQGLGTIIESFLPTPEPQPAMALSEP